MPDTIEDGNVQRDRPAYLQRINWREPYDNQSYIIIKLQINPWYAEERNHKKAKINEIENINTIKENH